MKRTLLTLTLIAAAAAWASAQAPEAGPIAAEQLQLFRKNQSLLEDLLESGLGVAKAGNEVDRAAACQKTARRLVAELKQTAADPTADPDRFDELAERLTALVTDGLAPTLAAARARTTPASPDYQTLKQVYSDAKADLDAAQKSLPSEGRLGTSTKVKDARGKLATATGKLGTIE